MQDREAGAKRIENFFGRAKQRLHDRMVGETLEVTQRTALDILAFAEQEALRFKEPLPLPPDFHAFRADLHDPQKVRAIIENGGKETNA